MQIQVFGIRHHGPGSASALLKALEEFMPDCILVEAPQDAEKLPEYLRTGDFEPPVAMLIYNPATLSEAAYVPFAGFSPEWQAMQFAFEKNIPLRFMDLPMSVSFALKKSDFQSPEFTLNPEENAEVWVQFRQDPLRQMAQLAGYEDTERWWEITFEHHDNPASIFAEIENMIGALRENFPHETPETLRREAFMRQTLRQSIKENFSKIAVVCGAWHVPAISAYRNFKESADKQFLKGIKKVKTEATWIPWSYERLTFESGYGAGISSPAWYELLHENRKKAVGAWMAKVAAMLRKEDLEASTANAVEAVRLAETLATLRRLALPGMEELKEAAVAVFGNGHSEVLDWIEKRLIVGDKIGVVPDGVPLVPLHHDLQIWLKKTRLSKDWGQAGVLDKKLDLRKESQRNVSHFLHRLLILEINWGKKLETPGAPTGSFHEFWKLKWEPDFALKIIEAGAWGNTVQDAATQKIISKIKEETGLPALTGFIEEALLADLEDAVQILLEAIEKSSALSQDVFHLADALPPLVRAFRYGSVRKTAAGSLLKVIDEIVPRIAVQLPAAVQFLEQDAAQDAFKKVLAVHHALGVLHRPDFYDLWWAALKKIAFNPASAPMIRGLALRFLFDRELLTVDDAAREIAFSLSSSDDAREGAFWLEGFLHGSGAVLLHHLQLWQVLNEWVAEISMENLKNILPLLRRAFANFTAPERQKLLQRSAQKETPPTTISTTEKNENLFEKFIPQLAALLK